jgi:capsular polysaccharide transport system permease protein
VVSIGCPGARLGRLVHVRDPDPPGSQESRFCLAVRRTAGVRISGPGDVVADVLAPRTRGMPLMPFIWSGYLPILMFRHTVGHVLYVVRSNGAMLFHRSVTPLDLIAGRCGLELIGAFTATVFSFLTLYIFGALDWPRDLPLFLVGNSYMAWWCFAFALIVAAASKRSQIVEHTWQPVSYMYLPVSGFMYMAVWLPTSLRQFALTVMPSLPAYEMIRAGLFGNQIQTFYEIGYLTGLLAVLTLIGL